MPPSAACATTTRSASTCPIPTCPPGGGSRRSATASARGSSRGPSASPWSGPNGVGKTTLLEALVHGDQAPPQSGSDSEPGRGARGITAVTVADGEFSLSSARAGAHTDRIGYLPQRVDGLDEQASVLENVRAAASAVPDRELRNRLARFLIRGDAVDRPVATLSGGERFRVALARLLLAEPPPQLLVLDEPTNNLDLDTVDQFVDGPGGIPGRGARGEPRRRVPRAAGDRPDARARSRRRPHRAVTPCRCEGASGRMAAWPSSSVLAPVA